jgi:DNA-directed RNA polymerase I subunit RPA2
VRPDEVSAQVRCHYLTDGTVNFAFTIRRSEYFIPAGVLLKCFLETTDREIFARLVSSAPKVRVVFRRGAAAVVLP